MNFNSNQNIGYSLQPAPIGNIIPIGGAGYNMNMGGYYNNMYNNYYNPYLAMEQQRREEAMYREEMRKQSDIMKLVSKSVNKACGNEVSDEVLEEVYGYKDPKIEKENTEQAMQNEVFNAHANGLRYNPDTTAYINRFNSMYEQTKEKCPDSLSLYECTDKLTDIYVETKIQQNKEKQKNLGKLYDSNGYKKLINMNSKSSMFDNNSDINIDDMEISLPNRISDEYSQRRQAFMDAILKG